MIVGGYLTNDARGPDQKALLGVIMKASAFIGSAAVATGLIHCSPAYADYCRDKPTAAIVSNGGVMFTSSTLCIDWCRVAPGATEDTKDRMLSVLMTAIAQDRSVIFFFNGACIRQPVNAEPDLVMFTK